MEYPQLYQTKLEIQLLTNYVATAQQLLYGQSWFFSIMFRSDASVMIFHLTILYITLCMLSANQTWQFALEKHHVQ